MDSPVKAVEPTQNKPLKEPAGKQPETKELVEESKIKKPASVVKIEEMSVKEKSPDLLKTPLEINQIITESKPPTKEQPLDDKETAKLIGESEKSMSGLSALEERISE